MKAFFIGLIFIIAAAMLSGIGLLLFPLFIVLGVFLKVILALFFVLFAIWLLGKFIIFIWDKLFAGK
jgi:hypothetical protein